MSKHDPNPPAGAILTPEEIAALTRAPADEPEAAEEPFGTDAVRLEPGGGLDVINVRADGEEWLATESTPESPVEPADSPREIGLALLLMRLHRIQARHALLGQSRRRRGQHLS